MGEVYLSACVVSCLCHVSDMPSAPSISLPVPPALCIWRGTFLTPANCTQHLVVPRMEMKRMVLPVLVLNFGEVSASQSDMVSKLTAKRAPFCTVRHFPMEPFLEP